MAMHYTGGRELQRLFKELPKRIVNKALRAAVTAGSAPVIRDAKADAPVESGLLGKSIGKKTKSRKGKHTVIIGARVGKGGTFKGRPRVPAKYIHLVAAGAKPHGKHPGYAGDPFLFDALNSNKGEIERLEAGRLRDVLEKEARKLGRR